MMATPEQEAVIRAIGRTCKGPLVIPSEVQRVFFALLRRDENPEILLGKFAALRYEIAPRETASETAKDLLTKSLRLHGGCGYDFNDTILANPLDGQVYEYICPRCGVTGTYRAPRF